MTTPPTLRALVVGWRLNRTVPAILVVAVAGRLAPSSLDLPQADASAPISSPTATILVLLLVVVVLAGAEEPAPELLGTAPRRRRVQNVVRNVALGAVAVVAMTLIAGGPRLAVTVAAATMLGEGLLGAAVAGPRLSWVLPTVHTMAAMTVGAVNRGSLSGWAWLIDPHPHAAAVALASVVLGLGSLAWFVRLRRTAASA